MVFFTVIGVTVVMILVFIGIMTVIEAVIGGY